MLVVLCSGRPRKGGSSSLCIMGVSSPIRGAAYRGASADGRDKRKSIALRPRPITCESAHARGRRGNGLPSARVQRRGASERADGGGGARAAGTRGDGVDCGWLVQSTRHTMGRHSTMEPAWVSCGIRIEDPTGRWRSAHREEIPDAWGSVRAWAPPVMGKRALRGHLMRDRIDSTKNRCEVCSSRMQRQYLQWWARDARVGCKEAAAAAQRRSGRRSG